MNRWILLAIAGTAATLVVHPRITPVSPPVELQPTSPGVQQVGSANISGKLLAGNVSVTNSAAGAQAILGIASSGSGMGYGGLFKCSSPSGTAVRGYATAGTGFAYGGDFQSDGPSGTAVRGIVTSSSGTTYGVYAKADSTGGRAVFGLATAATGVAYGGDFQSDSTSARGIRAVVTATSGQTMGGHFISKSSSGFGIFAETTSADGTNYAGYFRNYANSGAAVRGASTNLNAGIGGYFSTNAPFGRAVHGIATWSGGGYGDATGGDFESQINGGYGVYARSTKSEGVGRGVIGSCTSPNGYGVYSIGRTAATGTKSFRIDHPLDPENKYLNHYCEEGPQPLNVYSGTVVTDASGVAWVDLPSYFAEINKDYRYQLTIVGDDSDSFVQAKIAQEVKNNRFKVRTSSGKVKVCWEVKGIRNDLFVRTYGAPVEVDKGDLEKGTYQHPELYGKPQELSLDYRLTHLHREGTPSAEPSERK